MRNRTVIFVALLLAVAIAGGYLGFKACSGDFAFHAGKYYYYQKHDYVTALENYKEVKPSSPHYATAQRHIGHNIYGREWGQWEKGIPYLEEALRVAHEDPHVLEDAGRAYLKVGRVNEGAELLRKANTDVAQSALAQLDEPRHFPQ